jgi:hypothetical protein
MIGCPINNRSSLEKLRQILLNTLVIIKNIQEKIYEKNKTNAKPDDTMEFSTPMPLSSSNIYDNSLNNTTSTITPNNEEKNENNDDFSRVSLYKEVEEEIKAHDKFNICEEVSLEKILNINEDNKVILNIYSKKLL